MFLFSTRIIYFFVLLSWAICLHFKGISHIFCEPLSFGIFYPSFWNNCVLLRVFLFCHAFPLYKSWCCFFLLYCLKFAHSVLLKIEEHTPSKNTINSVSNFLLPFFDWMLQWTVYYGAIWLAVAFLWSLLPVYRRFSTRTARTRITHVTNMYSLFLHFQFSAYTCTTVHLPQYHLSAQNLLNYVEMMAIFHLLQ